jgi:hypothetical protein
MLNPPVPSPVQIVHHRQQSFTVLNTQYYRDFRLQRKCCIFTHRGRFHLFGASEFQFNPIKLAK